MSFRDMIHQFRAIQAARLSDVAQNMQGILAAASSEKQVSDMQSLETLPLEPEATEPEATEPEATELEATELEETPRKRRGRPRKAQAGKNTSPDGGSSAGLLAPQED